MAKFVSYLCLLALTVFLGTTCSRATSENSNHGTIMALNFDERPKEAWPWERVKFKCPSLNGVFSNIDDCSSFYLCVLGRSSKKNCPPFTKFDKHLKKCVSSLIAVCDKGDKATTEPPATTKSKVTTVKDITSTTKDTFLCPSVFGTFMHPTECNKYYVCAIFIPSLKTCSIEELFDGVKLKCKKAKDVDCGSRSKPTEATVLTTLPTTPVPETTTTPNPTTPEPTTPVPDPTTAELTTPVPETTTPEPTTPEPTTPEKPTKPTGPPETSCDENDLDCIIDDTGVTPDWFTCPEDIGSHPHPSSIKLFIFCLNWEPSVKKCGQDMVYSAELRTCVDP